jgi:hypothetical protein
MVVGRAREPTTNAGPAGMKESASPIDLVSLGGDKKIKVRLEDAATGGETSSVSYKPGADGLRTLPVILALNSEMWTNPAGTYYCT